MVVVGKNLKLQKNKFDIKNTYSNIKIFENNI